MAAPRVSVIIASQGRPDALALCLTALGQQRYHPFEVIVVACADGVRSATQHPLANQLKITEFSKSNLSAARNAGLETAAGEIVAFIDDDAIAEPFWLAHLSHPFTDPSVMAAGGYVAGRNGISVQWGARSVDLWGRHHDIPVLDKAPVVMTGFEERAVRTEGTNMAVRKDVLACLGGFDTSFAFYLDDTDLNMRLFRAGHATALVPMARVWHRQLASARRGNNREPRNLMQIGQSLRRFLTLYCPNDEVQPALDWHSADQLRRLLRHMVAGRIMPGDVTRQMNQFAEGCENPGKGKPDWISACEPPFRPLFDAVPSRELNVESRWIWQRGERREDRPDLLLRLSPTALYHKVSFQEPGYWLQRGGLWGRARRNEPLLRWTRFRKRIRDERRNGMLSRQFSPYDAGVNERMAFEERRS